MPVTCAEAATSLGVSASQVRRWVQAGAPVVRDRRPMLLDLDDLQRWRQHHAADALQSLATAMLGTLRAELLDGKSASRLLGIDDRRAAALMLATFSRAHQTMTGRDCEAPVYEAVVQLRNLAGL